MRFFYRNSTAEIAAAVAAILVVRLLGDGGFGAIRARADSIAPRLSAQPVAARKIDRKPTAGAYALRNGKYAVRFAFWQDHKQVRPDADRIIPLRRVPFKITFSGDISHVSVLMAAGSGVTSALRKTRRPIITMSGMGAAYSSHMPILGDKNAKLLSWPAFCKIAFGSGSRQGKKLTAILRQRFQRPPVVLDAPCMWLHAAAHVRKFTWVIRGLYINGDKELFRGKNARMAFFLSRHVDKAYIYSLKGRFLRLRFHGGPNGR